MNVSQASDILHALQPTTPGQSVPWLRQARQQAFNNLQRNGFPSKKSEDWKYTNVRSVLETDYQWQDMHCFGLLPEDIQHLFLPDTDVHRMVFVNGHFAPQLSLLNDIDTGVQLQSLATALEQQPEQLRDHLTHYAGNGVHGFAALNTAALTDGLYLHVTAGKRLWQPIHLLYLTTLTDKLLVLPRNLIWLEPDSEATVIEHHASLGEAATLVDAVTEIRLQDQAVLTLFGLHTQNTSSTHIGCRYVQQDRGSRFNSTVVAIGGHLVRDDITTRLQGNAAECSLQGLYLTSGDQQVDFHTCIEHKAEGCSSQQNYRGALDDRAHGIFNGRIIVKQDAQKSDARQLNNTLLLSSKAEMDSKPQLEIFADNVQCSHGATIGQLDEDMLFYLRSRGLDAAMARQLLVRGYMMELLDTIQPEPLRDYLIQAIDKQLDRHE